MNKKGFAISIIMYSLVFLIISIFYILLGIYKTRYTVTSELRESIMEELNESPALYDRIVKLGKNTSIRYVQKYNKSNGVPIDVPDGTGNKEIYYFTTTSNNRNSDAEQNANVIFGDFCWQIVRTTADGGVKLIYNGPKTNDNKCTSNADTANYSSNPRPSSIGPNGDFAEEKTTVSGNKLYGKSFEIINDGGTNKFRLKNTFTANWNGDFDNDGNLDYSKIIGTFSCLDTSSTCTTLYYVGHYQNSTQASTEAYTISSNSHYSKIGSTTFNAFDDSPALVGYMYNDVYTFKSKKISYGQYDILSKNNYPGSYYYGDTATWVTDHYELTIGGVTPTTTSTWSSIRNKVAGMYTCMSDTNTSCTTVYYVVTNTSGTDMYYFPLSNNEQANTKSVTWTIGTGYSGSNGNYTLTGTSTITFLLKDWYTTYNNYSGFYICDNKTNSNCTSEVYYVGTASYYYITYAKSSNTYVFANDVEYVGGQYKLILNDSNKPHQAIFEWPKTYNAMDNIHYTCFENYDAINNTCGGSIYFIYDTTFTYIYYVELTNGDKIENALQKMLNTNNSNTSTINKYNSAMKGVIESWYQINLSYLSTFIDDDAVFCNDRRIYNIGGWSKTGSTSVDLSFHGNITPTKNNVSLSCVNVTDRFSKNNIGIAELTYPVGLLTKAEFILMGRGYSNTGSTYWLHMTPSLFSNAYLSEGYYKANITLTDAYGRETYGSVATPSSIRPVIVLKPGTLVLEGNGTYNEPYIIDTSSSPFQATPLPAS